MRGQEAGWNDVLWVQERGKRNGKRWALSGKGIEMLQKYKQWISREVWSAASKGRGRCLEEYGNDEFCSHKHGLLQTREVFRTQFGSFIQQSF